MALPITARVNAAVHLEIGGCDAVELARTYGTPLYVYDESTVRARCRDYLASFRRLHLETDVAYGAKAYFEPWLARLIAEEGLGLDVVSGGELYVAQRAAFPLKRVLFHGNNKSADELAQAVDASIGRVVVDNLHELELLDRIASERGRRQPILLRLNPGIDAHTHGHLATGVLDSKFGFPIATGQAADAVARALAAPGVELRGVHSHIGSQIFDAAAFEANAEVLVRFAAEQRDRHGGHGFVAAEISPGGGLAVAYTKDDPVLPLSSFAEAIVGSLHEAASRHRLPLPRLIIEAGRSIVAEAGVALYTVGAIKDIPGVRTYVSVDGGMADNIRPALYGARYEVLAASRMAALASDTVTIAGKYCESGDILVKDVCLPPLVPGDVVAFPVAGAYCLPMASNYNLALLPAVVVVHGGQSRLVRRRQTYEDLLRWSEG